MLPALSTIQTRWATPGATARTRASGSRSEGIPGSYCAPPGSARRALRPELRAQHPRGRDLVRELRLHLREAYLRPGAGREPAVRVQRDALLVDEAQRRAHPRRDRLRRVDDAWRDRDA